MGLSGQTVNLEEARVLALANSRSLARYELSIRASVLDERSQLFSMLPQISANITASYDYLKDWEFYSPADTFSAGASLRITQVVFQGGKSFIERAIRAISTESIRKEALAEYFNVLDSIDNAYYAVLEAAAALEAEEASLQAAMMGFAIAEIRYSNGMINPGDYLKAMADKETRENSRNQARRNLTLSMTRFRNLTGITGTVELEKINFEAYEEVINRLAVITDEDSILLFEQFWNLLAAANPSLARAALSSQRAQRSHSLTIRDYSPTINATIFSTGINFLNGNSTSGGGITISGSIPVDFWVMSNRIERSRITRDLAVIDFTNTNYSLELELQNALSNIYSQAGSFLSSRRSLELTERHFNFVMERYRLSQSSVSDLNEATSLLITSRNNLNRASYSFLQSLSKLRSLCALDNEEEIIRILLGG